ncbi:MAG: inorganic phosphate transporter [Sinobacteraceae bacterium]|nr:inorganic phosphate transporter [Nevskiaceae bacterium]
MLETLGIDLPTAVLLLFAIALALSFEFVNGFHDTANAVATVIYTNSLKPGYAVVWSGVWNLIGVLTSSGAVAFGIVALLPVELVINVGSGAGFAMVFSLLVSAILWNLGTWYLGLPASSSHTLIGSIVGVGLMNSLLSPDSAFGDGVNWVKVADTVKALVFSPLIGFVAAALLLLAARALLRNPALFQAPAGNAPPPLWIRTLLILTCTGVSVAHGSNDGQKGMGLIVLILVGIVPAGFALDLHTSRETFDQIRSSAALIGQQLPPATDQTVGGLDAEHRTLTDYLRHGILQPATVAALAAVNQRVLHDLQGVQSFTTIPGAQRRDLRLNIYLVSETLARLAKAHQLPSQLDAAAAAKYQSTLKRTTNFIPTWVKFAVALALGLGTMIGWKRIVVTVGEKIGKAHLTYGQGACAEIVAFGTIEAADVLGLPVSTTHILSSGIAGTMVANGSGIQKDTVRNIILAWVLTLPVCVFLGATLFAAGLFLVLHVLGVH